MPSMTDKIPSILSDECILSSIENEFLFSQPDIASSQFILMP
jgi:hypothetical protein